MPPPSPVSSVSSALEAKLDRVADDLVGVIQALRLMSDMQRQQGEQLAQIVFLLTPEAAAPRVDLGELLGQLVGVVGTMTAELKVIGSGLERMTRALPTQLAAAVEDALHRADSRGRG